jgi:Family of unknown function (DUF5681)
VCTARSPSPHQADHHTGACQRWRLVAFLLLGPCYGELNSFLNALLVTAPWMFYLRSTKTRRLAVLGRLMTETTVRKQNKPWQFQPGQSGNPRGRPKGCRHRATVAAEALLDGEAEGLTRKAIELALAGDTTALRLCLERILPARKDRPVQLELPPLEGVQDFAKATITLIGAVAAGELTPAEAGEVAKLIEGHRTAIEMADLEERVRRLEEGQKR